MKYAKFNDDGTLAYIATDVPGLDTAGMVKVADDADANNLFLYDNGTAGPRVVLDVMCSRTAIVNDGVDKAVIYGLQNGTILMINGARERATGSTYEVTATKEGIIGIDVAGAHSGEHLTLRVTTAEVLMDEVRALRDALLPECDWTQMPDAPVSDEKKEAWRNYRTALRNISADQPKATPDTVVWPTKP